ncbi:hypothetical protein TNCV_2131921 [Trichonephila clavipes]|nr:hypothetical protein TNCV_2131921 [Trichonephila clavipes]
MRIYYRRKTDFFPEDTTMSYSGFEPSRLQAEGHIHPTGWETICFADCLNGRSSLMVMITNSWPECQGMKMNE